jgi:hypothetical protein
MDWLFRNKTLTWKFTEHVIDRCTDNKCGFLKEDKKCLGSVMS